MSTRTTYQFSELPEVVQDLIANISFAAAMLDRPNDPAQASKIRDYVYRAGENAVDVGNLVIGLLDHIVEDRDVVDGLRDELAKLGRRAFWARGRDTKG